MTASNNWTYLLLKIVMGSVGLVFVWVLYGVIFNRRDVGDFSSLIQAIVSVVLAFITVLSLRRADEQIEKAQAQIDVSVRNETYHALIPLFDPQEVSIVLCNLGKYPILVTHVVVWSPARDRFVNKLTTTKLIESGKSESVESFIDTSVAMSGNIQERVGDYVRALEIHDDDAERLNPFRVGYFYVTYQYAGSGSRVYRKRYKFEVDANGFHWEVYGVPWVILLKPVEFSHAPDFSFKTDVVNVPLTNEWEIPLAIKQYLVRESVLDMLEDHYPKYWWAPVIILGIFLVACMSIAHAPPLIIIVAVVVLVYVVASLN